MQGYFILERMDLRVNIETVLCVCLKFEYCKKKVWVALSAVQPHPQALTYLMLLSLRTIMNILLMNIFIYYTTAKEKKTNKQKPGLI